jgi:hypothetical protein
MVCPDGYHGMLDPVVNKTYLVEMSNSYLNRGTGNRYNTNRDRFTNKNLMKCNMAKLKLIGKKGDVLYFADGNIGYDLSKSKKDYVGIYEKEWNTYDYKCPNTGGKMTKRRKKVMRLGMPAAKEMA